MRVHFFSEQTLPKQFISRFSLLILFLHLTLHLSFTIIHVSGTVGTKKNFFFVPNKPTHLVLSDPLHTLHVMLLQAHQIGF